MLIVNNNKSKSKAWSRSKAILGDLKGTPASSRILDAHSPYMDDESAQTHDSNPVRQIEIKDRLPLVEAYKKNMLTAPAICLGFSVHAQTHTCKKGVDLINVQHHHLKYTTKYRPIGNIPPNFQDFLKRKFKTTKNDFSKLGFLMVVKSPQPWNKDEVNIVYELAGKALINGVHNIWEFLENQFCYKGVANSYKTDRRSRALMNIQHSDVEIQIVNSNGKVFHKHKLKPLFEMVDLHNPKVDQDNEDVKYFKDVISKPDSKTSLKKLRSALSNFQMQMDNSGLRQLAKMDFGFDFKNDEDKCYGNVMSYPNPSDPNLTCVQEFLTPALLSSLLPYGKNPEKLKYLHRKTIMKILMINKDKDTSREYKLIEEKICKFGSPYLDWVEVSKHVICFNYRIEQKDVNEVIKLKNQGYKLENPCKKQMKKTPVKVEVKRFKTGKMVPTLKVKDHHPIDMHDNFTFQFEKDITKGKRKVKKKPPIVGNFKKTPPETKLEKCDWTSLL